MGGRWTAKHQCSYGIFDIMAHFSRAAERIAAGKKECGTATTAAYPIRVSLVFFGRAFCLSQPEMRQLANAGKQCSQSQIFAYLATEGRRHKQESLYHVIMGFLCSRTPITALPASRCRLGSSSRGKLPEVTVAAEILYFIRSTNRKWLLLVATEDIFAGEPAGAALHMCFEPGGNRKCRKNAEVNAQ